MAWSDPILRSPLTIVWNFMRLVHEPAPADAILVLGSFDPNAALHAAQLWKQSLAPVVVMSGGVAHQGGLLDTGWGRPEAEVFAEAAIGAGVPSEAILLESQAQNTSDNFSLSRELLVQNGRASRRLIVVAKPYMTRRGYATGSKVWPGVELCMQCEPIDVVDYFRREPDPERTLLAMVGDLHRILVYPQQGFQIEQDVPALVMRALKELVVAGYGARLVPGYPLS